MGFTWTFVTWFLTLSEGQVRLWLSVSLLMSADPTWIMFGPGGVLKLFSFCC